MDSDSEMPDAPNGSGDVSLDAHTLIQAVRTLDQQGPGAGAQNLSELWRALSQSSAGQFHAVEQTVLRWLLKTMNPTTKGAADSESLRRYPLTWNILNCVFQRIPLFSLGKALADRRFIVVLRQAIKDISSPTGADDAKSSPGKKRKRSSQISFDVESLRTPFACITSAGALFEALKSLLSRLDSTSDMSSRDSVGAEHIKSLFASPATESLGIVGPALTICYRSLDMAEADSEGRASWVKVASDIWDLRLHGKSDALEVASRISQTTLPMLAKLDEDAIRISGSANSETPAGIRRAWASDLRNFLQRNLMLPARAAFMSHDNLDTLSMAVTMAHRQSQLTAPAIYVLAQNSPSPFDDKSKQKVLDWMNEVIKGVDSGMRKLAFDTRSSVMEGILGEAKKHGIKVREGLLRDISARYGFDDEENVRWSVVSAVLGLDPDVLFVEKKGKTLLDDILGKIPDLEGMGEEEVRHITLAMRGVIAAFVNAKDIFGFIKLWRQQLCKFGKKSKRSPWLEHSLRYDSSVFSSQNLELEMTVGQLVEILEWLDSQDDAHPVATYVILDSVCNGLGSAEFTDTVGDNISNIVLKTFTTKSASSSLQSLRWSVLRRVMAWLGPEPRDALWASVKGPTEEVLKLGKLSDRDTLQAFKFVFTAWSLMVPDADTKSEVSSVSLAAVERLGKEIPARLSKKVVSGWKNKESGNEDPMFQGEDGTGPDAYLPWYMNYLLRGSSRSLPLLSSVAERGLPKFLDGILVSLNAEKERKSKSSKADSSSKAPQATSEFLETLLLNENILGNEPFMRAVIAHIITGIGAQFKRSQDNLLDANLGRVLLAIPDDCFDRGLRVELTGLLVKRLEAVNVEVNALPSQWKLFLAVMTKSMRRANFSEAFTFDTLVMLADNASRSFTEDSTPHPMAETQGLAAIYHELALTVLQQMANHYDTHGKAFFDQAAFFVKDCRLDEKTMHRNRLRLALFKALAAVLSKFLSGRSPLTSDEVQGKLAEGVSGVLQKCCRYWKKKPRELDSGAWLYTLLTALDASNVVESQFFSDKSLPVEDLVQASSRGIQAGRLYGWKLRTFLLRHFSDKLDKRLMLKDAEVEAGGEALNSVDGRELIPLVVEYTDVMLQSLAENEGRFLYLRDLVEQLGFGPHAETQLTAIRCIVQKLSALPPSTTFKDFDLAAAYTRLAEKALQADSGASFGKVCEILHIILDGSMGHIAQWNIEQTLTLVATVCSEDDSVAAVKDSERTYAHLCKLVEAILKRHRLRLEGHFHILITTMQSLLRALLLHPYDSQRRTWAAAPASSTAAGKATAYTAWEEHAGAYNRLLTLICEPTAGSVARSHHGGALDAATDVAKRAAGRMMYLVLMAYVKIQMEVGVPRGVREALEPGVNAVFDVTPGEVRKVMNDGLDKPGREILGDLYKRYRTFGKWTGK